ncbi:MAG: hypothetical protein PHS41_10835, partial [Victivallaceae bacterium]|nr:hypothetical protein [Victivallaceae bacterium]
NPDLIMPMFISRVLPVAFLYIFSITLLSAAMSTMSSLFHVTCSSLGHDLYCTMVKKPEGSVWCNRVGILLGIAASVVLGYNLPAGIVARGTAIFFGICAAAFLPSYVAALYWRGATRAGVWASILTGAAVSAFGLLFLHRSESQALGLCRYLTGRTELIGTFPWPFVDTMMYALPLSVLMLVLVSLRTRKLPEEHLTTLFAKD